MPLTQAQGRPAISVGLAVLESIDPEFQSDRMCPYPHPILLPGVGTPSSPGRAFYGASDRDFASTFLVAYVLNSDAHRPAAVLHNQHRAMRQAPVLRTSSRTAGSTASPRRAAAPTALR
jgi:hypothetical protein